MYTKLMSGKSAT